MRDLEFSGAIDHRFPLTNWRIFVKARMPLQLRAIREKLVDMKEEIVHREILHSILALEVSKGHLKWTVSEVARRAKVSRPLLYYHFGKSKRAIMETCIALIGEEIYGLGTTQSADASDDALRLALRETRAIFQANPAITVFYQRWRAQASPLRAQFIAMEKRYHKKLRAAFSFLTAQDALVFHALMHGAITSPFLTEEAFEETCRAIVSWLKGKA